MDATVSDLLGVSHLEVSIPSPRGRIWAVDDVSFSLPRASTLGIVGESGSGKSMIVRSLLGVTPASATVAGSIVFDGVDLLSARKDEARRFWGRRIGMVFQDSMTSLNPVVRIGRQISETARFHLGLSRAAARERALDLLALVGIPDPRRRIGQYPHALSGGMRQRVAIAMALACDPDLLIADEATTALDVTTQQQILDLLQDIQRERHMALIMVSHDLAVVASRTERIAVMYAGRLAETGPTGTLFADWRHRYTEALLGSVPRLGQAPHTPLRAIGGQPAEPARPPGRLPVPPPRCPAATDRCRHERPALEDAGTPGHRFACFVPTAGAAGLAGGLAGGDAGGGGPVAASAALVSQAAASNGAATGGATVAASAAGASAADGAAADGALLRVEHLVCEFPVRGGKVQAVSDVSFSIMPGETLGLVGESGSGRPPSPGPSRLCLVRRAGECSSRARTWPRSPRALAARAAPTCGPCGRACRSCSRTR